ncbi:hypothetical protein FNU76_21960 [Chitinimonas arctica]|uniref:Uncharacterized protein n=1 Tax=Chitinimonas arctica TaxID=2594795 RepID=A0A516SKW8_9NEIS|nr:hypothetical protein [Chitinimonas arctica]QDQ28800.1 hypothetical protein FNU76_21960 [Chitinimonas arctica]
MFTYFSRGEGARINRELMERKTLDLSGLSPQGIKIIRETRFSREEINRAFAAARKDIAYE